MFPLLTLSISFGAVAVVMAQQTTNLTTAIQGIPQLSNVTDLVLTDPCALEEYSTLETVTAFLGNDDAFVKFEKTPEGPLLANRTLTHQALNYAIVNGLYRINDFTDVPTFLHTHLADAAFSQVSGGQVLKVARNTKSNALTISSGQGAVSNVILPNQRFNGGIIHVLDTLLSVPQALPIVGAALQLQSLVQLSAVSFASTPVTALYDITVFAPPFDSTVTSSNAEEYWGRYVVKGVSYSTDLTKRTTLTTIGGEILQVTHQNGVVSVNGVKVTQTDVLLANGVAHVLAGPVPKPN